MYFKFLAFLGLVFLLVDIHPSLAKETNASRLRRGLPLLPPKFLSRTKRETVLRPWSHPRRIQIFAGNDSSLGFIQDSTPTLGVNHEADHDQDLRIKLMNKEPFDIIFKTPNILSEPLHSGMLIPARPAANLPRGSRRTASWSVDKKTNELKALYTPPHGSNTPIIVLDTIGNTFHFVEHPDTNTHNFFRDDSPVILVKLFVVKE
ncbi:hypothetical protein R3P38DRAFT_3088511 [Favolaschia claudopus]|uniref:Uncharacterized protein n=1 Tax=Favolaschia claudopus TaxID=2862362 RepID=A0AAV9ZTH5_9AGAR